MDKLQAMEVFVQVVDAGGFTRAAENMQLPKATVSTLIRNLETALSIKLLNRTTRQISVTADGAAYYERCLSILAEVRDAEESLSRTKANPSGRLRVDVPTGLGRTIIIPSLPAFFERYPDIELEMGCSDRTVDLIEEGVDCAVRGGTLADSTLVARRVGELHFATCASPSYLARYGRPQTPDDLVQHRAVNYFSAKTGKLIEWDFAKDGRSLRIRPPGRFAVNDSNAYMAAALAGMGLAQMPSFAVQPYVESGQLELVLDDWCIEALPLHVVYPQNRHLSAKVRAFVEWIAELFADESTLKARFGESPLLESVALQIPATQPRNAKKTPAPLVIEPAPGA
jgi:LysR family transcriptional regulator, regulator for bpeEF and oprC